MNNNIQNKNNDKLQDWHDVYASSLLRVSDGHPQITNDYSYANEDSNHDETPTTTCARRLQSTVSFCLLSIIADTAQTDHHSVSSHPSTIYTIISFTTAIRLLTLKLLLPYPKFTQKISEYSELVEHLIIMSSLPVTLFPPAKHTANNGASILLADTPQEQVHVALNKNATDASTTAGATISAISAGEKERDNEREEEDEVEVSEDSKDNKSCPLFQTSFGSTLCKNSCQKRIQSTSWLPIITPSYGTWSTFFSKVGRMS